MTEREEALVEVLRSAGRIVRAAELPEHLQPAALSEAVRLMTPSPADRPRMPVGHVSETSDGGTASGALAQVATELALESELIGRLFTEHDGDLQVTAPPSRLAHSRRAAMRELIHLTVLGRHLGGWDNGATPVAKARQTCEGYGPRFFDANNFQNAINDLGDQMRRVGQGRQQSLILTPLGRDEGRQLVQRLAATPSA